MAEVWASSDWHLFHDNMFKTFRIRCIECGGGGIFDQIDLDRIPCMVCGGTGEIPARPFSTVAEMHDCMIEAHNARVKPRDHYYNLGDFTLLRSSSDKKVFLNEVKKFQGHGRGILGNHDHFPVKVYAEAFEKVRGLHRFENLIFSHVPLHPSTIPRGCVNVHGHIHTNPSPPGPYINVSVEALDYAPINIDELRQKARKLLADEDPF